MSTPKRRGRPSLRWFSHTALAEMFGVEPDVITKACELGLFARADLDAGIWSIPETSVRRHLGELGKLYTVTQFADLIGLDARTVRQAVRTGRIRSTHLHLVSSIPVRIPRSEFYRLQGRAAPPFLFSEEVKP